MFGLLLFLYFASPFFILFISHRLHIFSSFFLFSADSSSDSLFFFYFLLFALSSFVIYILLLFFFFSFSSCYVVLSVLTQWICLFWIRFITLISYFLAVLLFFFTLFIFVITFNPFCLLPSLYSLIFFPRFWCFLCILLLLLSFVCSNFLFTYLSSYIIYLVLF